MSENVNSNYEIHSLIPDERSYALNVTYAWQNGVFTFSRPVGSMGVIDGRIIANIDDKVYFIHELNTDVIYKRESNE